MFRRVSEFNYCRNYEIVKFKKRHGEKLKFRGLTLKKVEISIQVFGNIGENHQYVFSLFDHFFK